jgi:hypothetical protein
VSTKNLTRSGVLMMRHLATRLAMSAKADMHRISVGCEHFVRSAAITLASPQHSFFMR